eukprot:TRINITY_DN2724_c0_g2_i1.p1 TRINITY_DN2724_c0_g2~~TRINITY_DN2724_c0_g2_i1.p1  ORF type:complete len:866 (+),score=281.12 TRINITY_DN2724_c0_g2_i1:184-2781(+)
MSDEECSTEQQRAPSGEESQPPRSPARPKRDLPGVAQSSPNMLAPPRPERGGSDSEQPSSPRSNGAPTPPRRKKKKRSVSKKEAGETDSESDAAARKRKRRSTRSRSASAAPVCDSPIRDAGEEEAKRKRMEKYVLVELLETEKAYNADLDIIKRRISEPLLSLGAHVFRADLSAILSSVSVIYAVNSELLRELEAMYNKNDDIETWAVGSLFLSKIKLFSVYKVFCLKTQVAIGELLKAAKRNSTVKKIMKEQQEAEECRMMGTEQFLMKPFQRITKYPLLFRELLKSTPESHPDYADRVAAFDAINEVVNTINRQKGDAEQFAKVVESMGTIDKLPEELRTPNPDRVFLRSGILWKQVVKRDRVSDERLFHLYNDMLLYSKETFGSNRSVFKGKIAIEHILIQEGDPTEKTFQLTRSDKKKTWLVTAKSSEDKAEWVKAMQTAIMENKGANALVYTESSGHSPMPPRQKTPARPSSDENDFLLENGELDYATLCSAMLGPGGVEIKNRTYMLKSFPNCFLGSEAVDWLCEALGRDRGNCALVGREMIKRGLFYHVTRDHDFEDRSLFYCASTKQCLNTSVIWETPARAAEEVAAALLAMVMDIFKQYDDTFRQFGYDAMSVVALTPQFEEFQAATCELQMVDLSTLQNDLQRAAFYCNVYHALLLHSYILEPRQMRGTSMGARLKILKSRDYKIGKDFYNCWEIEHLFLRANSYTLKDSSLTSVNSIPKLKKGDPRLSYGLQDPQPFISFALHNGAKDSPGIRLFSSRNLSEELMQNALQYNEGRASMTQHKKTGKPIVCLPKPFQWYTKDFGSNEKAMTSSITKIMPQAVRDEMEELLMSKKPIPVKYDEYDWQFVYPEFWE